MSIRRITRRNARTVRGYTLVELLIVIGVLGLAGAMLIPHLVNREDMAAQAVVRMLVGDLSFAQSDALAHQEFRRVYFYPDGSGYCLYRVTSADYYLDFDPDMADYLIDPIGSGGGYGAYIVKFGAGDRFEGVSITDVAFDTSASFVTFDALGGTVSEGNIAVPGAGGQFTVASATSSYQIELAPFTGKLTVTKLLP